MLLLPLLPPKHLLCLFPVRRERNAANKQSVSDEATVATLSWCICGRGRQVVDIVLLLQQQHNSEISTSLLTEELGPRVVAKLLQVFTFAALGSLHLLPFCVHCTCVNTHFNVKDGLGEAGEEEKITVLLFLFCHSSVDLSVL